MEIVLRCSVPDRPGALSALTGAIAEAGVDIQGVDVVESGGPVALDDLLVVLPEGLAVVELVRRIEAVPGITVVHAGPSRGNPGDGVTRLAVGLEALLNGAMALEEALRTLLGGLLRATSADLVAEADAPKASDRVLPLDVDAGRVLVLRRDHRFTPTEQGRARAVVGLALEAARTRAR